MNLKSKLIFGSILLLSVVIGLGAARHRVKPKLREITFEAEKYAYNPARLHVNVGDTLRIKLVSKDVTHGFYLEGFDFRAYARAQFPYFYVQNHDAESEGDNYEIVESYTLVVDKVGKFRYRCSVTCGPMHPFMQGELIVGPNYPFAAAISLSIGLMVALLVMFARTTKLKEANSEDAKVKTMRGIRINLFAKFPWLHKLMKMRSFQFLVILPNLVLFYLFLIAGLFGTPVGNRNIIIVFVWILWWVLLIAIMVPFGSRVWCTICPLPAFGEWVQRGTLTNVRTGKFKFLRNRLFGFKKDWPKPLQNIWMQNIGFLFLAVFSALLVTRPIVSVSVLGTMILLALALSLIFRQRAFCMYLCPVSGFLGLYAMTATIELRSKDRDVCRKCKYKNCLRGSELNYGCPWYQYLGEMGRNNYCGLCMECVKNCPYDNIALNLRPFASDTKIKGYDEAWKAFIMITLALVYSVTLLGPWGLVKNWANVTESGQWSGFLLYGGIVIAGAMVLFPALYSAFVWLSGWLAGEKEVPLKKVFLSYSYTLVPLGLLAWIAFSVPLLLVNGSYIVSVISDPLGWGWNLFGTAAWHWSPVVPHWVPFIQIALLLTGLYYSLSRGFQIGRELFSTAWAAVVSAAPMAVFVTAVTMVFLTLYVG